MAHPVQDKYIPGVHLVVCDYCRLKWYSKDMKKTWDGFMSCPRDYDPKHIALEPMKVYNNELAPIPDARAEPPDLFVSSPTANKIALGIPDLS
jgi:hypothetical protein